MKLLNKTGLYYFVLSLLIMVAGAFAFYLIVLRFADKDVTEKLYTQELKIKQKLSSIDSIPSNNWILSNDIRFKQIADTESIKEITRDTVIHEEYDNENVPYRTLTFKAKTRHSAYAVTISQSLVESDDLIGGIVRDLFILILIYLVALILINYFISRRIWKPFHSTLARLHSFDVQRGEPLKTDATNIAEFKSLNEALEQMTAKIQSDYRNLKEFTENASHEIQTPLAIIRSKIELLLQTEGLSETQWNQLSAINEATDRLSRLNQSLLLLSKIENGQFNQSEIISLTSALKKHLDNFRELASVKKIQLQEEIEPDVTIRIHPYLLDILLSNLLMNAIRHNTENGFIKIHLKKGEMTIQNAGAELSVAPEELFNRFKKGSAEQDSIGIGLSIVQKITSSNGMKIKYSYADRVHSIQFSF